MKWFFATLLLVHGSAHLVGFGAAYHLGQIPALHAVLAGRVSLSEPGAKLLGWLWLSCAVAFTGAAFGVLLQSSWWLPLVLASTSLSFALSTVCWPEARLGVLVNVVVLGMLFLAERTQWLSGSGG
jgi:hypothetical protein